MLSYSLYIQYSNIRYSIFNLRSYVLMIEDTVDGKDIEMVSDIMMYPSFISSLLRGGLSKPRFMTSLSSRRRKKTMPSR